MQLCSTTPSTSSIFVFRFVQALRGSSRLRGALVNGKEAASSTTFSEQCSSSASFSGPLPNTPTACAARAPWLPTVAPGYVTAGTETLSTSHPIITLGPANTTAVRSYSEWAVYDCRYSWQNSCSGISNEIAHAHHGRKKVREKSHEWEKERNIRRHQELNATAARPAADASSEAAGASAGPGSPGTAAAAEASPTGSSQTAAADLSNLSAYPNAAGASEGAPSGTSTSGGSAAAAAAAIPIPPVLARIRFIASAVTIRTFEPLTAALGLATGGRGGGGGGGGSCGNGAASPFFAFAGSTVSHQQLSWAGLATGTDANRSGNNGKNGNDDDDAPFVPQAPEPAVTESAAAAASRGDGVLPYKLVTRKLPVLSTPRTPLEQRLLAAALSVVAKLEYAGFGAMFAGGWVRDQFLGRVSADIDMVTNATIIEVYEVFGPKQCRLKGGNTCDVTWDGHTFEVTSYRGGLRTKTPEAEWRDAACRDFTINALFFRPDTSSRGKGVPVHPGYVKHLGSKDRAPPTVLVAAHAQPPGYVCDYVGGLEDLAAGLLRVYPHHERLGLAATSVEADPIRVLRAARLSLELGLKVDPYTESRIRKAAKLCASKNPGVTPNRIYKEFSKMAGLDVTAARKKAAAAAAAVAVKTSAKKKGGASGSGVSESAADAAAIDGGPGSPLFSAALDMCHKWRVLEAIFPGLPTAHLERVIREVIPRLPARLPLDLKLACLAAGAAGGDTFFPPNQLDKYQPVVSLLSGTRLAQPHWAHLLCGLSDLVLSDFEAASRQEDWAEVLAADGADMAQLALEAFVDRSWRSQLREGLADIRTRLQPRIQAKKQRRPQQGPGGA